MADLRDAARMVADAVRGMAPAAEHGGRYRATVLDWTSPASFRLDLHGEDLELDADDVIVGQTAQREIDASGVQRGDVFVLLELGDADFVIVDIEPRGT